MLDSLGNIPFLRAVRPLERPQMMSVFRTYIDIGNLLPFAVFTALAAVLRPARGLYRLWPADAGGGRFRQILAPRVCRLRPM